MCIRDRNSENDERCGGDWKNETVRWPAQNFHAAACLNEVIGPLSAKRYGQIDAQLFTSLVSTRSELFRAPIMSQVWRVRGVLVERVHFLHMLPLELVGGKTWQFSLEQT